MVVITGHNCTAFVERNLGSLALQDHKDWAALYLDDASSDGTSERVVDEATRLGIASQVHVRRNPNRRFKAASIFKHLTAFDSTADAVFLLDGDDWLAESNALSRFDAAYQDGWDVVWANWRGTDGTLGTSGHLCPFIPVRRQPWVTSMPFSFRRELFKSVCTQDLQSSQGRWFRAACDVALATPILEQTIRRRFLDEVLYVYNRSNPLGHNSTGPQAAPFLSQTQLENAMEISARPGTMPPVDRAFFASHLWEMMEAATKSTSAVHRAELQRLVALIGQARRPT